MNVFDCLFVFVLYFIELSSCLSVVKFLGLTSSLSCVVLFGFRFRFRFRSPSEKRRKKRRVRRRNKKKRGKRCRGPLGRCASLTTAREYHVTATAVSAVSEAALSSLPSSTSDVWFGSIIL